jgi:hypothetical protein
MNENELSIVILSKQNHVRWSAARTIDGSWQVPIDFRTNRNRTLSSRTTPHS